VSGNYRNDAFSIDPGEPDPDPAVSIDPSVDLGVHHEAAMSIDPSVDPGAHHEAAVSIDHGVDYSSASGPE